MPPVSHKGLPGVTRAALQLRVVLGLETLAARHARGLDQHSAVRRRRRARDQEIPAALLVSSRPEQ